jgi:hypothetical protein
LLRQGTLVCSAWQQYQQQSVIQLLLYSFCKQRHYVIQWQESYFVELNTDSDWRKLPTLFGAVMHSCLTDRGRFKFVDKCCYPKGVPGWILKWEREKRLNV